MYLSGSYEHALDEKNRIRIPKKMRDAFPSGDGIVFVKYAGGCIAVFPESTFNARISEYESIRSTDTDKLIGKRFVMLGVEYVKEDTQNRIVLSQSMRNYAGIKHDIITIGMVDYLEMWAPDRLLGTEERGEPSLLDQKIEEALQAVPM